MRAFRLRAAPVGRTAAAAAGGPDLTQRDYPDAAKLGTPFKIIDGEVSPFRLEVAKRIAAIKTAAGVRVGAPLPAANRARVRTEVARELFHAEHGREPIDARELAGQIRSDLTGPLRSKC
jgi:hypothetical protein